MAKQEKEIKLQVEFSPGYEKRYTAAVLQAYQRKANREGRTIGGVFHPQKGSRDEE